MTIFKTLTTAQAQGVSYFGALVTSVSAWSVERLFSTVGLLMGLITFLVGLYASRRRIKHENEQEKREKILFDLDVRIKEAELFGFQRRLRDEAETGINFTQEN
jgi:amino acid transporter